MKLEIPRIVKLFKVLVACSRNNRRKLYHFDTRKVH